MRRAILLSLLSITAVSLVTAAAASLGVGRGYMALDADPGVTPLVATVVYNPVNYRMSGPFRDLRADVEFPPVVTLADAITSIRLCVGTTICSTPSIPIKTQGALMDRNGNGLADMRVTFDGAAVRALFAPYPVPSTQNVTVTGVVMPAGTLFIATGIVNLRP